MEQRVKGGSFAIMNLGLSNNFIYLFVGNKEQ